MNWLDVAKRLPAGRRRRIKCCAKDNSMLVSHTERGYTGYCFRCREPLFEPHGERSISDALRHRAELKFCQTQGTAALPDDCTDVPLDKAVWFLKCGISMDVAQTYGFCYSPTLNRIIIPIRDDGKLVGYQGRSCDPFVKPKYLNQEALGVSTALFWTVPSMHDFVVVTEDVMSAIKIRLAGFNAVSLLGTTTTNSRAVQIARKFRRAIIWLDGDKAGMAGRVKCHRQLQLQGVDCDSIATELDPKALSREEIKGRIDRIVN